MLAKPQQSSREGWRHQTVATQQKLLDLLAWAADQKIMIKTVYGYVAGTASHVDGRTWDIMILDGPNQKAQGDLVRNLLWAMKDAWDVHYVVWRDRIYSTSPGKGGNAGLPYLKNRSHFYHVHVTFRSDRYAPLNRPLPVPGPAPAHLELVPDATVTLGFGVKGDWEAGFHTGIDLNVKGTDDYGRPARTTKPCLVVGVRGSGWGPAYGRQQVIVQYEDGRRGLYAHMSAVAGGVTKGARLPAGHDVGRLGWSGNVRPKSRAGTHLHYEERVAPYRYGRDARAPILEIGETS